jgi:N-methylhydantoinase A
MALYWRGLSGQDHQATLMAFVVAVDIGGTFTDLVAYDHDTGEVRYTKSPTTYGDFVAGIMECMAKARIASADMRFVNHGTTLVINALIERRGAKAALIATKGFRDVLEIARGNRPDPFDLHYRRDEPLIPRELRYELAERIAADGSVIEPLDEAQLEALASVLAREGVEAVAVSFMNAYANPIHEERAATLLAEKLPRVYVTRGTELSREWYEYERTSTAAANAYVGPQVSGYVATLDRELRGGGFAGTLFMMGSNGGVLSAERAIRQPIALVESGPIGGCIGTGAYAEALGFPNVISFDMGGTTAKCALVEDGRFSVDQIYYAGGYVQGFPIKSAVIDIIEVGSGGGSVAWLDAQNRLHVGPRSAGSTPGPVCYGRGGTEPTVTDANLVLGRLDASRFLGGELALDADAAKAAILEHVAAPLGYAGEAGAVEMADGIVSIATVVMAGAIRRQTVEHGRDPRDFVLFSYGGGGPLHASALAHELSIPTVVVPPEPGNFSASGMLLADARLDTSQTFVGVLDDRTIAAMAKEFAAMEAESGAAIRREIGVEPAAFMRAAEMRYRGQRHNIKVPITGLGDARAVREAFDRDYKRRYGHADTRAGVEIQALHLAVSAPFHRPDLGRLTRAQAAGAGERGTRKVYFGSAGGFVETRIYDRFALPPGFAAPGPAIIEEYGSTTVVWAGDRFEIGPLGEIRIYCAAND